MPQSPSFRPSLLSPSGGGRAALDAASGYARQAMTEATRRAYAADWNHFVAWCASLGGVALPAAPEAVAAYLASLAPTYASSTVRRRLVAIGQAHRLSGQGWIAGHPTVRATLRGILRRHGAPARQAAAITTEEIQRLVATCDDGLTGLRDRALLLLGYAGALRRAELVAVAREHLEIGRGGLRLLIPRSKTDPEGEGAWIGIPRGGGRATCPVRSLEAWLLASGCVYGPVFRKVDLWGNIETNALHPDAVRQILRRRAKAASIAETLSPHGLRAGFVTEAYRAGARDEQIMAHTRHRDLTTMRAYVRRAKLVSDSPAGLLGL
jgi:integrase